jgi:hypothetical protein
VIWVPCATLVAIPVLLLVHIGIIHVKHTILQPFVRSWLVFVRHCL